MLAHSPACASSDTLTTVRHLGTVSHMNEITANRFRDQLKAEVDRAIREHQPLRVSRRRGGDFVVLSAEDWSAVEETLYLNRIPGLVKSIQRAAKEPVSKGTRLKALDW